MKKFSAIGLMSGTSADGVSAAWIDVAETVTIRGVYHLPFSRRIQERVLSLKDATTRDLCDANMWLGLIFARAANRLID